MLGDHTMFWRKHQQDELAKSMFAKLIDVLRRVPGSYRELGVRVMQDDEVR